VFEEEAATISRVEGKNDWARLVIFGWNGEGILDKDVGGGTAAMSPLAHAPSRMG
jgi:hypothetical protein